MSLLLFVAIKSVAWYQIALMFFFLFVWCCRNGINDQIRSFNEIEDDDSFNTSRPPTTSNDHVLRQQNRTTMLSLTFNIESTAKTFPSFQSYLFTQHSQKFFKCFATKFYIVQLYGFHVWFWWMKNENEPEEENEVSKFVNYTCNWARNASFFSILPHFVSIHRGIAINYNQHKMFINLLRCLGATRINLLWCETFSARVQRLVFDFIYCMYM